MALSWGSSWGSSWGTSWGTTPPDPPGSASPTDGICNILLEDGTSLILLEDGSGSLLLEVCDEPSGRREVWWPVVPRGHRPTHDVGLARELRRQADEHRALQRQIDDRQAALKRAEQDEQARIARRKKLEREKKAAAELAAAQRAEELQQAHIASLRDELAQLQLRRAELEHEQEKLAANNAACFLLLLAN